ncbi:MAG: outer membrane beta-barrel protein, partial [Bacteroidota bacterium]
DQLTLPAGVNNEFDIKLQYVEIPLTLKMLTNPFGKIRVYGQFGVSPGYLIRAESSNEINGDNDFMDYANDFNMNMIIGSGIEYTISGSTVAFVGLEFNNGFLNVFDKKFSEELSSDAKIKGVSNYLGIHAGVLF